MKTIKRTKSAAAAGLILAMLFTGCGKINSDAVLMEIDGGKETITLGYANFAARYTQSLYDSVYLSYYGTDYWSQEESGETAETSVKDNILDSLKEEYVLNQHAEEYDIALTEDEEAAVKKAAEEFIGDNSEETLEVLSADVETVTKFLTQTTIASKVREAVQAEAEVNITQEEAAQRTFTYAYFNSMTYTDDNGNTAYYTDEEHEALKEKAEALTNAADLETEGKEAGATVTTHSYGGDDEDTMPEAVIKAADALKEGEISPVIEVEGDGYYVLRLDSEFDEEATADKMESMESEARAEYLQDKIDGWLEETTFKVNEKQWEKVKFDSLFRQKETEED